MAVMRAVGGQTIWTHWISECDDQSSASSFSPPSLHFSKLRLSRMGAHAAESIHAILCTMMVLRIVLVKYHRRSAGCAAGKL